jgi:SAM-dependent methyltransferase
MNSTGDPLAITCPVCGHHTDKPRPQDLGVVRGNTERFRQKDFPLWKCPDCLSIISTEPVDFHDIYRDYPLNTRELDVFARHTLRNLLRRLRKAGLKTTDRILDYGCGNGLFVDFLAKHGYPNVTGYDPYVTAYARPPGEHAPFDVVVNNDTIEHCDDVHAMLTDCVALLRPGGLLYLGTADSEPVEMSHLEPHVMRLHQPFHRIILTEPSLHKLVGQYDMEMIAAYRRSYLDTRFPFANYRFLDEMNRAVGHNLDRALDADDTTRVFLRTPRLWFFALFGYWFPSANEPAVVLRKRESTV